MASSNATRSAITAPIAAIFRVNDDLIAKALEGLNAAELGQRLTDKNNPMLWIAGHWAIVYTPSLALLCRNPAIVGNRHRSIDKNHRGLSRLDVEGPLQLGGIGGAIDTQIA